MTKNWIAGAIKHPGALHKQLHVPEGQKIPAAKLEAATHSSNPLLAKRANLAKTLGNIHHSPGPDPHHDAHLGASPKGHLSDAVACLNKMHKD